MNLKNKKQISAQYFEKIRKELEFLKKTKRKEISKKLCHAISFGDLKENAAYHEAKEEQAFLEGKIIELENKIKNFSIISPGVKSDKIMIGSKVSVTIDGRKEKYEIVEGLESDPLKGKISSESPMGKALLERKEKDVSQFETPSGKVIEMKILEIN